MCVLTSQAVKAIEESVLGDKPCVAFAVYTSKDWIPYLEAFTDFFEVAESLNYQVLVLKCPSVELSHELSEIHQCRLFEVASSALVELDFVDIFLTLDWNPYSFDFPKDSKIVAFTHYFTTSSFRDQLHNCIGLYGADLIDYHFISAPKERGTEQELKGYAAAIPGQYFPAELVQKKSQVIPGGYPKLDRYIDYCSREKSGRRLLFCVTGLVNGDATLENHGEVIIKSLLESFPDYEVVFRPSPRDRNHRVVLELKQKFKSHERFVFDASSEIKETYARSKVMICDVTNARTTFAYATLRPYVRCCFGEASGSVEATPLGENVFRPRELIETVSRTLENLSDYEAQIRYDRDEKLVNAGVSLARFAHQLEYCLRGECHPDWFEAQKSTRLSEVEQTPQDYLRYIEFFNRRGVNYVQWSWRISQVAFKRFPDNVSIEVIHAKVLMMLGVHREASELLQVAIQRNASGATDAFWGFRRQPGGLSGVISRLKALVEILLRKTAGFANRIFRGTDR